MSDPGLRRSSGPGARSGTRGLVGPGALGAVLVRPALWPVAVRVLSSLGEPGWWRRWPPLPRLPEAYAELRRETMWGPGPGGRLGGSEAVEYLRWVEAMSRNIRRGR
ncbi:MAG: hypothetical protein M0T80_10355 [Actinomycetota bacterium]|nr:hypothetical protein [Actinomycetota bacterium]